MRKIIFRIVAILLPFIFIVACEGIVRLFEHTTFFIPVSDQPDYQTVNPAYASRYFRGFTPQVAYNPFLKHKPDSVFRIVTLGGSTTAGYPYPFYLGFPERFAARFRSIHPERPVEVINLGMTALSSHVLRDMTTHVMRIKPDAVLIYSGHNEYYGAYGAASQIPHPILIRALLWFKKSELFRRFEGVIAPPVESNRTMMAQSTTDVGIVKDGRVYRTGIENFDKNLDAILEEFHQEEIPTYIGLLVSNLMTQPPLGQDSTANRQWNNAHKYWANGDTLAAKTAFMLAKEYDPIRFRAPQQINQVIVRRAQEHGAVVVKTGVGFLFASSDSLFTDHLHPTALGYDMMAEAFLNEVEDQPSDLQSSLVATDDPSPLDAAYARLLIMRLRLGFPFTVELSEQQEWQQFKRVLQIHQQSHRVGDSLATLAVTLEMPIYEALLQAYKMNLSNSDTVQALAHMRSLLYWQPFNQQLHFQAAELASKQSSLLAGEVMQLVVARQSTERYLNTLAALRLQQGALEISGTLLRQIESAHPESHVMLYNMARYLVLTGDTVAAEGYYRRYQNQRVRNSTIQQ